MQSGSVPESTGPPTASPCSFLRGRQAHDRWRQCSPRPRLLQRRGPPGQVVKEDLRRSAGAVVAGLPVPAERFGDERDDDVVAQRDHFRLDRDVRQVLNRADSAAEHNISSTLASHSESVFAACLAVLGCTGYSPSVTFTVPGWLRRQVHEAALRRRLETIPDEPAGLL